MRGVRAASDGIDHHLGIAVVGGDEHGSAFGTDRQFDTAQTGVHSFDRLDGGLDLAGMADHVSIGEIHDDDIESSVFDGFDDGIGDARRRTSPVSNRKSQLCGTAPAPGLLRETVARRRR